MLKISLTFLLAISSLQAAQLPEKTATQTTVLNTILPIRDIQAIILGYTSSWESHQEYTATNWENNPEYTATNALAAIAPDGTCGTILQNKINHNGDILVLGHYSSLPRGTGYRIPDIDCIISVAYAPQKSIAWGTTFGRLGTVDIQKKNMGKTIKIESDSSDSHLPIRAVIFSPNHEYIAIICDSWRRSAITLFNSHNLHQLGHFPATTEKFTAITYSLDGKYIIAAKENPLPDCRYGGLATSSTTPYAEFITGPNNSVIQFWNSQNYTLEKEFPAHDYSVLALAAANTIDGSSIILGTFDKKIKILDAQTGRCLHILDGHDQYIKAVTYCPADNAILSVSSDNKIKKWVNSVTALQALQAK